MTEEINVKPGDTVWVSRYALSRQGITMDQVRSVSVSRAFVWTVGLPYVSLRLGIDCHATPQAAAADADARRIAKIASLRKQIAKLEKLSFDGGESDG